MKTIRIFTVSLFASLFLIHGAYPQQGFDDNSIGAIAVASSDPETVWVGTGEDFNCRLTYPGNGIYRSLDGGAAW